MPSLALLLLAAAAAAKEPLTTGQKNVLAASDLRSPEERRADLLRLQSAAQALADEAGPLLSKLSVLTGAHAAGGALARAAERAAPGEEEGRAELRGALMRLRGRQLSLDEEFSVTKRAHELDIGRSLVEMVAQGRDGPKGGVADYHALEDFHESLRRLRRDIDRALQAEERAYQEALARELARGRERRVRLALGSAAGLAALAAALWLRGRRG